MEVESVLRIVILVIGFYMAWNIGANDVSNAMGTSVGSGALALRKAVFLAAILEFCGAFFLGSHVSETMQSGLIDLEIFSFQPMLLVLGMCGALLGTGIWLQIASYCGWPVSTTHAIVGAILGFGGIVGGVDALRWGDVLFIVIGWVLSPFLSAVISYLIFNFLQRKILFALDPVEATKKMIPYLAFIVFGTFTLSLIFNGLDRFTISFFEALCIALSTGLLAGLVAYFFVQQSNFLTPEPAPATSRYAPHTIVSLDKATKHLQRVHASSHEETQLKVAFLIQEVKMLSSHLQKETNFSERTSQYRVVEKMFIYLQIISACFVAFAHGSNDVANAIGPIAAVFDILKNGAISDTSNIPTWLLAFGGLGIVLGLATWGWRVIETIGKKITELTPTRGFCAEFGAATTILLASKLGLPISTTHCIVGAVLGVGLARGIRALNLGVIRDIILSWIITIPASAVMSILLFLLLKKLVLG